MVSVGILICDVFIAPLFPAYPFSSAATVTRYWKKQNAPGIFLAFCDEKERCSNLAMVSSQW